MEAAPKRKGATDAVTKETKSGTAVGGAEKSGPTHVTPQTKYISQVATAVADALTIREAPLPQAKSGTAVAARGKSSGRRAKAKKVKSAAFAAQFTIDVNAKAASAKTFKSAAVVTQSPVDVDAVGGSAETSVTTRSSLAGVVAEPKSKAAVSAQNTSTSGGRCSQTVSLQTSAGKCLVLYLAACYGNIGALFIEMHMLRE